MKIQKTTLLYQDQAAVLEGFVASPTEGKHPAVILCHSWRGRDDFICERTETVASWGYVGFALDMYGKGILGKSKEDNAALKQPFLDNREFLQTRILKALETAQALPYVDPHQIAVVGLGFGGLCALDLARSGANVRGAVSLYGHLHAPPPHLIKPIQAKILVLHGYNDPITPQNELLAFEREMDHAKVDWQVHVYGGTLHAFATPGANDPTSGLLYNPVAARRAWLTTRHFLHEVFDSESL